jgi:uncharacterized protein YxjI
MRYIMTQRFFSFADSFTIRDEHGNDAFMVEGHVFSFGHKLSFCDTKGNEMAFIQQRLMTFRPSYEIYVGDQLYAVVKKQLFTFFNCRFDIEVMDGSLIEVEGNIFDHEYSITVGGKPVAAVSKEWFAFRDTYGIDVRPGEDDILMLSIAVTIDLMCHDDNN